VCDRLAEAGFVALAPDLYHGELAEHDEMDKAGHLMTSLDTEQAVTDMGGAITALLDMDVVSGTAVGVVGYCMGGMLSLLIAAHEGDRVRAVAPFYGAPVGDGGPDWSGLTAKVVGHFAENDDFFTPEAVHALGAELRSMGKDVSFTVYPGSGHAFTNEENPLGTFDAELTAQTWISMIELFNTAL
jgi:carboxymethylenebutenolidase